MESQWLRMFRNVLEHTRRALECSRTPAGHPRGARASPKHLGMSTAPRDGHGTPWSGHTHSAPGLCALGKCHPGQAPGRPRCLAREFPLTPVSLNHPQPARWCLGTFWKILENSKTIWKILQPSGTSQSLPGTSWDLLEHSSTHSRKF